MWEPSLGKRILMIASIWGLPFVGAYICYKYQKFDQFKNNSYSEAKGQAGIGTTLLEMDTIFNPGQRHTIEVMRKVDLKASQIGAMKVNKLSKSTG